MKEPTSYLSLSEEYEAWAKQYNDELDQIETFHKLCEQYEIRLDTVKRNYRLWKKFFVNTSFEEYMQLKFAE